jgi:hypothetical protein
MSLIIARIFIAANAADSISVRQTSIDSDRPSEGLEFFHVHDPEIRRCLVARRELRRPSNEGTLRASRYADRFTTSKIFRRPGALRRTRSGSLTRVNRATPLGASKSLSTSPHPALHPHGQQVVVPPWAAHPMRNGIRPSSPVFRGFHRAYGTPQAFLTIFRCASVKTISPRDEAVCCVFSNGISKVLFMTIQGSRSAPGNQRACCTQTDHL